MDEASRGLLRAVGAGEGDAYWFLGTLITIKATGEDTGGAFSLLEQLAPPGFGPPLHVHHREDEPFLVLEGRVRFRCGDQEFLVEGGGYVFLPKGIPHTFRIEGSTSARLMQMTLPPGFERVVQEIACSGSKTSAARRNNARPHRAARFPWAEIRLFRGRATSPFTWLGIRRRTPKHGNEFTF